MNVNLGQTVDKQSAERENTAVSHSRCKNTVIKMQCVSKNRIHIYCLWLSNTGNNKSNKHSTISTEPLADKTQSNQKLQQSVGRLLPRFDLNFKKCAHMRPHTGADTHTHL